MLLSIPLLILLALIVGAFFAAKRPPVAIAFGLLLMMPFAWTACTVYVSGTDQSVGAILAVGSGAAPDQYHWSYWGKSFIKERYNSAPVLCRSRPHFAVTLDSASAKAVSSNDQGAIQLRLFGQSFSIPAQYRAKVRRGNPNLEFYVVAPTFATVPASNLDDDIHFGIEINGGKNALPEYLLSSSSSGYIVEDKSIEYGLQKRARWYVGSGQVRKNGQPTFSYYSVSDDYRLATVIECSEGNEGLCRHQFHRDGWTLTFKHHYSDLRYCRQAQSQRHENHPHEFLQPLRAARALSQRLGHT